jgi:hypothetical protein
MLTLNDITINCDGYNFVDDRAVYRRNLTLNELLELTEDLFIENGRLNEEIEDLNKQIEENYRPIPVAEQVGISDSDFI